MSDTAGMEVAAALPKRKSLLRRWLALACGLGLLWIALAVGIPAAQRLPSMAPAVQTLLDSGIEVTAIYYTGVEKVAESEATVRAAAHWAQRPPQSQ